MKMHQVINPCGVVAAMSLAMTAVSGAEPPLPDPDGQPADMTKPVQVYILMGQSNMVGAGNVNGDSDGTLTHAVKNTGKTMVHAGYKGYGIWEKGTEAPTSGWYAGTQYDADVDAAKRVLKQLDKYYPGAKGYEVAGFFWCFIKTAAEAVASAGKARGRQLAALLEQARALGAEDHLRN